MESSEPDNEIIVTVHGNKVTVRREGGGEHPGEVVRTDLSIDTIEVFQDWINHNKISSRRELEVLGRHLFDVLFNGEARYFFVQHLDKAKEQKGRLRVQLSFDREAADLAALPWEYLYYAPQTGRAFFLSTEARLVLSRYIPLETDRGLLNPEESPLRLLLVVSQPDDPQLGPVVAQPVIGVIQQVAKTQPIEIDLLERPTVSKLLEKLEKGPIPHVLHFVGHGRFNQERRQGEIALLNMEETGVAWVSDTSFAEYFYNMDAVPRLVLLHLCEGGAVDFETNFAGLAPKLILAGVQAVVAMQHRITNKAAISFSRAFYRELGKGSPVDQAVQRGRWRITTDDSAAYDNRVFGTPVLYMHSRDGIILPAQRTPATREAGRTPAGARQSTTAPTPHDRIVNDIRVAAYTEAGRRGIDEQLVKEQVEGLILSGEPKEIRDELTRRIQQDPLGPLASVWIAIAGALKAHGG